MFEYCFVYKMVVEMCVIYEYPVPLLVSLVPTLVLFVSMPAVELGKLLEFELGFV